jgi:hypothetical protein
MPLQVIASGWVVRSGQWRAKSWKGSLFEGLPLSGRFHFESQSTEMDESFLKRKE